MWQTDLRLNDRHAVRWDDKLMCSVSRQIWPLYMIATLAAKERKRLVLPFKDYCRGCQDKEEEETVEHFLCQRPSPSDVRIVFFGSPFLNTLSVISSFVHASGWFGSDPDCLFSVLQMGITLVIRRN